MSSPPELSIVIPVHNEAESLPVLWDELVSVLARLGQDAEVIFVDDASRDSSADVIHRFVDSDTRVRLLRFETHAGLTAAFFAGLRAARGSILATMDSDLQNDPRDLEVLLMYLAQADAVVGSRVVRYDPWLKRISSRIANAIRNRVTGDRVVDSACSLRVMRRECVDALAPYDGMHRFFPTLLRRAGYRVIEVPIQHRPRPFGQSKFGIGKGALPALLDLLAVA
jgi:dolichol-phosphate mannosyltransferase